MNIAHDKGEILGERYEIFITHPHFQFNDAALKVLYLLNIGLIRIEGTHAKISNHVNAIQKDPKRQSY